MWKRVKKPAGALAEVLARFHEDGGMYMAASISYYALMSLLPLVFALINLLGYFLGRSPDLQAAVLGYVKSVYPMIGATLTREITRVVEHSRQGWLGIALFLWLGSLVFNSIEHSINTIFKVEKRRRFWVSSAISFGMVMLCGIVMMASFWVAYIPTFIMRHQSLITETRSVRVLTKSLALQVTPVVLTFLSFTFIYKLLPNRKVPLKAAALGGLTASCLWEAAKYAFAWYIGDVADISGIYGSLTAIIIFLLWIFYSSAILLLVAEMVFLLGKREKA